MLVVLVYYIDNDVNVLRYIKSRGTWGTMKQKNCFVINSQTYSVYFAETIFYMKCSKLLTFWFIDVLISSQQTSLEIKNHNFVICFIVPHWWGRWHRCEVH
jgi:hypothetical protein